MGALKNRYANIVIYNSRKITSGFIFVLLLVFSTNLQAQNITDLEYFFGNDPGIGNGSLIAATANTGELTQSIEIPLTSLASGFHKLTFRTKNDANNWSLYHRKTFYIIGSEINDAPSNLAAVEYWFDEDPGNGIPIPIAGAPSETVENFAIPLGTLDAGFHTLSIRIKNEDDTWSLYHRKTFYIISPATNDEASPLTDAEFLFDELLGYGTGTTVAITPTGNPDEYIVEIPRDLISCGLHNLTLSVRNALGNYSLYDIITDIDLTDNAPPTIVVFPNITVEIATNSQAPPITIADIDNGTFDDCQLVSVELNQAQFNYTCTDLGPNTVTVTATDAEGNVSTLDVILTVEDNFDPVAIGQDITLQLDVFGNATTTADAVDNNSTDNCGIADKNLDISSFTCDNIGTNTVTLTVIDQFGNEDSTNIIVTVEDNFDPVAIGQDITIDLAGNASISIDPNDVDNGSSDNCGEVILSIDIDTFTTSGVFPVILTATDSSGNTHNNTVSVTVVNTLSVDNFNSKDIDIFPNPTTSKLHFNFTKEGDYSLSVYTISGKVIFQQLKLEINNTLDLSNYASGIYIFKIKDNSNNTFENVKIVKL